MEKCTKCGSEDLKIGIAHIASGATVYPIYCGNCKEVFAQYVKKQVAYAYAMRTGPMEFVKTKTNLYMERKNITINCEVCGANGGELHHWAPQYLFEDADNWPKSYLCRACHRKWHDLVTPNMIQKK